MRKLCGAIVVLTLFFAPRIADAENLWDNFQLMASANLAVPVTQYDIAIAGSANVLWDVADESVLGFLYLGGRFRLDSWYTLHIMFGATIDFPTEDVYGFDVSLWHSFRFFEGLLTLFIETDMIFYSEGHAFYGVYATDLHPFDFMNIGFKAEQVNGNLAIGPHIGFTASFFHIELQHFSTVVGEGSPSALRIRMTVGLNF